MNTVLLTGANGFLGSHLARRLLDSGYAVRAFVRPSGNLEPLAGLPLDRWQGDLRDADHVLAATYGCDFVIHAGALAQVNPARSSAIWDVNVKGTENVLAAARRVGVQRLVYVGTANVFGFGSKEAPGDETQPYMGTRYGLDYMDSKKKATEQVLQAVRYGLQAVLVHPTFMLGPMDTKPTSNEMILALYRGQVPGYPPGGKNYVHVDDVATAITNALTQGTVGESYILGNENLSYREAFTLIADVVGVKPPRLPIPAFASGVYAWLTEQKAAIDGYLAQVNRAMLRTANDEHYFSVAKARAELSLPQTPVRQAVAEAFTWFGQNGYLTKSQ
ncbi:MAG: NAD-dependent epimerase/dehydratase family protein [Bacteroidetes bacterium]|nr:NAD-dependent epimerase/dehydratase family protein [Fibrella sp.]